MKVSVVETQPVSRPFGPAHRQRRALGASRSESAWAGCEASSAAAIVTRSRVPDIGSQSVTGAEKGGAHRPAGP